MNVYLVVVLWEYEDSEIMYAFEDYDMAIQVRDTLRDKNWYDNVVVKEMEVLTKLPRENE